MAAAQRFLDNNGRPRLPGTDELIVTSPRKSHSTAPSSGVSSSASSSLITQGVLAAGTHITPHTTPPHPEPVKPPARTGVNALQTIQELVKINGGLPEDAVDDDSSYGPSLVAPHHTRAGSFDNGHDKSAAHAAIVAVVESEIGDVVYNGPRRSQLLGRFQLLTEAPTQVDGLGSDVSHVFQAPPLKKTSSSMSSGSSHSSCRSTTLVAMSHNCVHHAGQSGGSACPRNSPTRKRQSGADPFPDEATKHRFRTERTVLNANIREHSYMTNHELRSVMDDRACVQHQRMRAVPAKLAHNANFLQVEDPKHDITCPPGFEAHAAAGLLPFQVAAARRAADRMTLVKLAATERSEVIQEHATDVERKLASPKQLLEEENDTASEA